MKQGKKFDTGKLPVSLLPFKGIVPIIQVLEFGAKKYGRNNWKLLNSLKDKRRLLDALGRHYGAILDGEAIDPESGLPHLAHLGCNVVFLLWHGLSQDDLDRLMTFSEYDGEPDDLDERGGFPSFGEVMDALGRAIGKLAETKQSEEPSEELSESAIVRSCIKYAEPSDQLRNAFPDAVKCETRSVWSGLLKVGSTESIKGVHCDVTIVDSLEEFPAADTGVGGGDPAAGSYVRSNPPSAPREPS